MNVAEGRAMTTLSQHTHTHTQIHTHTINTMECHLSIVSIKAKSNNAKKSTIFAKKKKDNRKKSPQLVKSSRKPGTTFPKLFLQFGQL